MEVVSYPIIARSTKIHGLSSGFEPNSSDVHSDLSLLCQLTSSRDRLLRNVGIRKLSLLTLRVSPMLCSTDDFIMGQRVGPHSVCLARETERVRRS